MVGNPRGEFYMSIITWTPDNPRQESAAEQLIGPGVVHFLQLLLVSYDILNAGKRTRQINQSLCETVALCPAPHNHSRFFSPTL